MGEAVLMQAEFDPKVKVYWYLHGALIHAFLVLAFVGIVTLPLWLIFGLLFVRRQYEALSAQLTERSIHLSKGVLNRVEKTVPLEKIQDVSLRTGPLLDAFGLASVQIETAGSSAQGAADMVLPGLANAQAFRDAVLAQRDACSDRSGAAGSAAGSQGTVELLSDIRDSLRRIEAALERHR